MSKKDKKYDENRDEGTDDARGRQKRNEANEATERGRRGGGGGRGGSVT